MPLTCWCKQCGREVPPGDSCPACGGKLNPNQAHVTWKILRRPATDWMCWNAVMRIVLPVLLTILLLALLVELLSSGPAGLETLFRSGMFTVIGLLLASISLLVLLLFVLRGQELLVCTLDGKGVHIQRYLPKPTAFRLLLHFRSPGMLRDLPQGSRGPVLIGQQDVAWKQIARVQLWPEKSYVLFYAPAWWQRLALPCAPITWADTQNMIRSKIGKKKNIILPPSLREQAAPKTPRRERATQHARPFEGMDEPPHPPAM